MDGPIEASIVVAGDVELMPDRGRKPDVVPCAFVIQFDTPEDLKRAMNGAQIAVKWNFERNPPQSVAKDLADLPGQGRLFG